MKKKVSRRRTQVEIMNDETTRLQLDKGFAMALILLCQDEIANHSAQEIIEIRCKDVFIEAGYTRSDFNDLHLDPADEETLDRIFEI